MMSDARSRVLVRHDGETREGEPRRSTVSFEDGATGSTASFTVTFPDQGSPSANLIRAVDEATAMASRFLSHQITPIPAP